MWVYVQVSESFHLSKPQPSYFVPYVRGLPFSVPSRLQQINQKGQTECATAQGPDGVIIRTELLTSPLCRQGKDCASLKGLKLPSRKLLRGQGCRNRKDAICQRKGALQGTLRWVRMEIAPKNWAVAFSCHICIFTSLSPSVGARWKGWSELNWGFQACLLSNGRGVIHQPLGH